MCSTDQGFALQTMGVQYRLKVCGTDLGFAGQTVPCQVRVCSKNWGYAGQTEVCSTDCVCAVQAEGVQFRLEVCRSD